MTTEIEKQFFDTFKIKPKYTYLVSDMFYTSNSHSYEATKNDLIEYFEGKNCGRYKVMEVYKSYPRITDHILLELMCIRCKELISIIKVKGDNQKELKNYILKLCIEDYTFYSKTSEKTYNKLANNFKYQVRTLFKEG